MRKIVWSNRIGNRSRRAWLLLIDKNGTIHHFTGDDIPEVVVIEGHDYKQEGKWSHTTYRLTLAPGVRDISGHNGWETGRFTEGLRDSMGVERVDLWIDVANALGVDIAEAKRFLRKFRPREAAEIDRIEESLSQIPEGDDHVIVSISFGAPTRRERENGWWNLPVIVTLRGREIGRVTPENGKWTASGQIKLVRCEHERGHHGGYISMRISVPDGAEITRDGMIFTRA